jgi:hypothetical protein
VLVLMMGVVYEVHRWDGIRSHCIHTKFYEGYFVYSGNTMVITSTCREAAVLVLLMGRINDVCRYDDLRCYDIYITSFMTIGSGIRVRLILRSVPQQFNRLEGWYYRWDGFRMYPTDMVSCGMIYTYEVSWRLLQELKQYYGCASTVGKADVSNTYKKSM